MEESSEGSDSIQLWDLVRHCVFLGRGCRTGLPAQLKCAATIVRSMMSTVPSLFKSAFGFQLGEPETDPKAMATMLRSIMFTLPSPLTSPGTLLLAKVASEETYGI